MLKVKQILPKVINTSAAYFAYKSAHVVASSKLMDFEMGDPRDKKKTGQY